IKEIIEILKENQDKISNTIQLKKKLKAGKSNIESISQDKNLTSEQKLQKFADLKQFYKDQMQQTNKSLSLFQTLEKDCFRHVTNYKKEYMDSFKISDVFIEKILNKFIKELDSIRKKSKEVLNKIDYHLKSLPDMDSLVNSM
ncbi:MAG: hypothetical protein MHPSP_001140, partial [Paramarteilia canceri]